MENTVTTPTAVSAVVKEMDAKGTSEGQKHSAEIVKDVKEALDGLTQKYQQQLVVEDKKLNDAISAAKTNAEAMNELKEQVTKGNAKAIAGFETTKELIDKINANGIKLYDRLVKAGSIAPEKSTFFENLNNGVVVTKDGRPLSLLGMAMSISLMSAQDYVITQSPVASANQTKSYGDIFFKRNGKRYFETPKTVELRDSKVKNQFEVAKVREISIIDLTTHAIRTIPFVSAVSENISAFISDTEAFREVITNTDKVSVLTIAPTLNTVIVVKLGLQTRIASGMTVNALINAVASFVAYGFNPILGLVTSMTANPALDYLLGNKDGDSILTLPVSES